MPIESAIAFASPDESGTVGIVETLVLAFGLATIRRMAKRERERP